MENFIAGLITAIAVFVVIIYYRDKSIREANRAKLLEAEGKLKDALHEADLKPTGDVLADLNAYLNSRKK